MIIRFSVLALTLSMLPLTGCKDGQSGSGEKKWTIAVVPKGTTHEFWKAIHAGAVKAEREIRAGGQPVEIIWKGPLREDDKEQQVQVVETFASRQVNGIVLAPLDSQALVNPVRSAMQSGVPVVVIDSDLKSTDQVSFVATDNHLGGVMAGEHLAKLLSGSGNVLLLRYQLNSASTEAREAGFLEAVAKHPGLKLIPNDERAGPTRETAYQVSQALLNRFGAEVNGVFCPNETSTISMTKALRDIGKGGGAVKMIGFDAGTQSVIDLKNGDLQGLIVQNPFRMGYLGVMTLAKHLRGEPVEKRIDTGVTLVTKENMDQPEVKDLLAPPLKEFLDE
jgi:ribose transport system substrate-binding protein